MDQMHPFCGFEIFSWLSSVDLIYAAAQKKGYMNLQEVATEDTELYCYGNSLRKDPTATLPSSWSPGNPSLFLIRGPNYLQDKQKVLIHSLQFCFVFKM